MFSILPDFNVDKMIETDITKINGEARNNEIQKVSNQTPESSSVEFIFQILILSQS